MRLEKIADDILAEAVDAQAGDVFDSHDIIFWVMQNYPRQYAADLHGALSDEGDPFVDLHAAVGRHLAQLTDICCQRHEKRASRNVRGEETACEVWNKVARPPDETQGLSQKLGQLRDALVARASKDEWMFYGEAAELLSIGSDRLDHSAELAQSLDEISTFELQNGRPLLSAIVVHKDDKFPGSGFFKMAKRNGEQPDSVLEHPKPKPLARLFRPLCAVLFKANDVDSLWTPITLFHGELNRFAGRKVFGAFFNASNVYKEDIPVVRSEKTEIPLAVEKLNPSLHRGVSRLKTDHQHIASDNHLRPTDWPSPVEAQADRSGFRGPMCPSSLPSMT